MRIALVSGANTGIGLEIGRGLGQPDCGYYVLLGSRKLDAGQAAVTKLKEETPGWQGEAVQLDITDDASVAAAADTIARRFGGHLHALCNNAGFAYKGDTFGADEAETTIGVNVRGTARLTHAMLPFLKAAATAATAATAADATAGGAGGAGGSDADMPVRICNVCSQAGRLAQVSPALQSRFQDPAITEEGVYNLLSEFTAAIRADTLAAEGWPRSMYGVSKLGEIALTGVWARDLEGAGIVVNAVCPGYCATSMSSYKGPRSPAKGADTPIWLLTRRGAVNDLTGGFYYDRTLIAW